MYGYYQPQKKSGGCAATLAWIIVSVAVLTALVGGVLFFSCAALVKASDPGPSTASTTTQAPKQTRSMPPKPQRSP